LHNLQYTCKTIDENRNGKVTDYFNNNFSIWLRFRSDRSNEWIKKKLSFEFYMYPSRHRFNRSSLLRSSYIDFIVYFLFYCSELLNSALTLFRFKYYFKFFFTYKTNCISFLRKHYLSEKNRFFFNFAVMLFLKWSHF